jgi:tetratricopeptide (TPR) repeat protein
MQTAYLYEQKNQPAHAILHQRKVIELLTSAEDQEQSSIVLARLLSDDRLRRYDEANRILSPLVQQRADAAFARGTLNLRLRNFVQAEHDFTTAIEFDDAPLYHYYRAVGRSESGDYSGMEEDLKAAISKENNFAEAYNFLGYTFAEKNIRNDESLKLLGHALALQPFNASFLDSIGWANFRAGKKELARYHLSLAVILSERDESADPVIYEHLGDVCASLNLFDKSIDAYKKALYLLREKLNEKDASAVQKMKDQKTQIEKKLKELNT